jgi:hypothetical protein
MHLQPEEPVLLNLEDRASLNFAEICTISSIFSGILFAGDFSTGLTPTSLANSVFSDVLRVSDRVSPCHQLTALDLP